ASRLLSVELAMVQIRLWGLWQLRRLGSGRDPVHGTQYHQFRVALLRALAPEKSAEDRDIAQARNLVRNVRDPVVDQAGDDEALAVLQFEFRFRLTGADGGDGGSGDRDRIREVQGAHFGGDMEVDAAVGLNDRGKFQVHAKLPKLNGDGGDSAGVLLGHGKGKFSTSQKAG